MNTERALLMQQLRYDPATGHFFWRVTRHRVVAGMRAGYLTAGGYVRVTVFGKEYCLHRLAWLFVHGEWPPRQVDHRNLDTSDNRIVNLRPASHGQNQANKRRAKHNSSGFKGVSFNTQKGRFVAQLAGRHIGYFDTAPLAAEAYAAAAKKYFGEFARSA